MHLLLPTGLLVFVCLIALVACVYKPYTQPLPRVAGRTLSLGSPLALPPLLPRMRSTLTITPDAPLLDLRHDGVTNRLYVSDTAGNLHLIDAQTNTILRTLSAPGSELILDPTQPRLYAAPGRVYFHESAQPQQITVIDTASQTIIAHLPGTHVALDEDRQRLFVGESVNMEGATDQAGVRIYDATTLTLRQTLPYAGVPVYNPLRDELLILGQMLHVLDLTQQTLGVSPFPSAIEAIYLFPEANLLVLLPQAACPTGCPWTQPPHYFDATTLEPLPDQPFSSALQGTCGSQKLLLPSIMGQIYHTYVWQRQVAALNLLIYADHGDLLTWRDGLAAHFINPQTWQAYLVGGKVLDLATLMPVGEWPEGCILAYDAPQGLLYVSDGPGRLQVIEQQGGVPPDQKSPQLITLAGQPIRQILPSPDYLYDQTILVVTESGRLVRSTDGGITWVQVRGGLPTGNSLALQVAFSPNYAVDRTLFAGGYHQTGQGEGIWQSTDGGDSWTPLWQGLTHLRVTELRFAAQFSRERTLWAKAAYHQIAKGEAGYSWHRATLGDDETIWSLVATGASERELAEEMEYILDFPASVSVTLPVRIRPHVHTLDYRPTPEASWQPVKLPLASDEWVLSLQPAPTPAGHAVIYALSDYQLWRTEDGGQSWQRWQPSGLQLGAYPQSFRLMTLSSPSLDGHYHLFLATHDGQFLALDPAEQSWQLITEALPLSTAQPQ